nr:long-chain-fatty-acid--CoA ligase [Glycomyces sambucus]
MMQDRPLEIGALMRRAQRMFAGKAVVTGTVGGETAATWGGVVARAWRLSAALGLLGVPPGARVGTFAWNTQRHLELYLAVPAGGRVLHTVNHRLHGDDVAHILHDAADDVVFVDRSLLPAVWDLVAAAASVRRVVVMDDGAACPVPDDPRVLDYEELLGTVPADHEPPRSPAVAEDDAAGLCYTSGTTGRPKGVLYSHRSVVLHALTLLGADALAVSERDTVMPVVPMFHVNAWGLPYAALAAGAALVLPGPAMAPEALADRLARHRVTLTAGVPAIWRGLLPHLPSHDLSALRTVVSGGSALPDSLSRAWEAAVGIPITGSWGMTECSPLVAAGRVASDLDALDGDGRRAVVGLPGPTVPLVDVRIVDDAGRPVPHDGVASGELQVAGPTIAAGYFGADPGASSFTADGWLRTGDVASLDAHGYLRIVDRTKDMIKSGGEWISSVALEQALTDHPLVREAAVVGVEDERWGERPRAYLVLEPGAAVGEDELRRHLLRQVAAWWIPDRFTVVDAVPRTATGKTAKAVLRSLARGGPGAGTGL